MDQLLLVSGRVTLCYLASANVGNGLGFGFRWLVSGMVTGVVFGGGGWLMMLQLFAWLNDDSDDDVNVAMGGGCWSLPPPLPSSLPLLLSLCAVVKLVCILNL